MSSLRARFTVYPMYVIAYFVTRNLLKQGIKNVLLYKKYSYDFRVFVNEPTSRRKKLIASSRRNS